MENFPSMKDKVVLITGATGGIGRVAAEALAGAGAKVVIIGRNAEKTAQAAEEIGKQAVTNVDFLIGDLSAQADVRRLAQEFRQRHDQLHVLINNAGAFFTSRKTSPDGIEMTFALNHLGYFLFTNLLLDVLIASAQLSANARARIINVSSAAHVGGRLHLDQVKDPERYSGWSAYSESKLANVYFTYELARRLEGKGVTANALHPGFVATNFGRSNGGLFNPLFRLFQIGAISPEEGAKTTLYLATSPEVEGITGKYFDRCKAVSSSPLSYDVQMARKLWDASVKMTGLEESV
jgi:NAD(P)-dependent dehydrogenase (short-subunit alcohol dehydrogenase family)